MEYSRRDFGLPPGTQAIDEVGHDRVQLRRIGDDFGGDLRLGDKLANPHFPHPGVPQDRSAEAFEGCGRGGTAASGNLSDPQSWQAALRKRFWRQTKSA
jgi:hypothetical protein